MAFRLVSVGALFLAGFVHAAAAPPWEQWVVVVAPAHRESIAPLVRHRQAQGCRVVVLPAQPAAELRRTLAATCRAHRGPSSILLFGAALAADPDVVVPACAGSVSRMIGQPTDAAYGCLDGTRTPSVAVGRLPARSEGEARAMVRKIIALESAPPAAWKRRLTVLAGIPAFNPVVDRFVESLAFARFDRLHPAWSGQAVYTSPSSRFRLPGPLLRPKTLELLGRGQLLALYLGHSDASGLYGGEVPFLNRSDFAKVKMTPCGVFVTFGCLGGQLGGIDGEGYALAGVRNPDGPASAIASQGICFASMVQLAANGLMEKAFTGRLPSRLGECWLAIMGGVAEGPIDFLTYRMLDAVDGDPSIPQATQRQEHLEMFVLLGDPAMRLPAIDDDITLTLPESVAPGGVLSVRGLLPARLSGSAVEVVVERTPASLPVGAESMPGREAIVSSFERANRFEIVRTTLLTRGRDFATELKMPESLPWTQVIVRVRAADSQQEALTAKRIAINASERKRP